MTDRKRSAIATRHIAFEDLGLLSPIVGHAAELEDAGLSTPDLRSATAKPATEMPRIADAVFSRWLTEIG